MKVNRTLFKNYLRSADHKDKHLVEKMLCKDHFAMDALEGFAQQKNSWQKFEAFDRKYFKKERLQKTSFFGLALLLSLALGWYAIPEVQKTSTKKIALATSASIKIHKQVDVKKMMPAAVQERITPRQVEIELNHTATELEKTEVLERIQHIPAKQIAFKTQKENRMARQIGRELVLQNFKVVDYRYYRKKTTEVEQTLSENELGEQILALPYLNVLNKAIKHFAKEDYKLALLLFDDMLANYPEDANALFYGGMCLYNLKEFSQAEGRLMKLQTIAFGNFSEEGNWYLLHVYQKAKKEAAFESLQHAIITQKGFYATKAENLRYY